MKKIKLFLLLTLLCAVALTGCKNSDTGKKTEKKTTDTPVESAGALDYDTLSVKALELYALENDAHAAYRLGQIYDYGLMDESQNYTESIKWYETAAKADYGKAHTALGYCYLNGCGVDRNYDTAKTYFTDAIKCGDPEGYVGLGRIYLEKEETENYHMAYLDFRNASAKEALDGYYYMGYMYENGYGVSENVQKAMLAYQLVLLNASDALEDKYAIDSANTRLGILYATGKTGETDGKKACEYFETAAGDGFALAQYYLGTMYLNGIGVDKDYEEAFLHLEDAANQDYAPALCQIGYMYFNGMGVDPDYEQAVYYQKLAAAQGYAPAQVNLGFLYENGYGVEMNPNNALSYYLLAYDQGYEGAAEAVMRVMDQHLSERL